MNLLQSLFGQIDLEITSADRIILFDLLRNAGIEIHNIRYLNELVLAVQISRKDYGNVLKICEKSGASIRIIEKKGVYWHWFQLKKRPVLLIFLFFILFVGIFLPGRVLFIRVEGNSVIPENYILESAAECGIKFGVLRRNVRSEAMKNALLQKIPDIQWAGINTTGCTAIISVQEKTTQQHSIVPLNGVCSIVASRDGIIQNMTVLDGNPICSVGQAVKKGQTLVSGYLDCGIMVKTCCANAEVNALTFRRLNVISPNSTKIQGEIVGQRVLYSLCVGKKVINLYKDSGILGITCDKIYSEEYVVLPGSFVLPVSVIKQTICYYMEDQQISAEEEPKEWLMNAADDYLLTQMVAGQIISAETELNYEYDAAYFRGQYVCTEMIGQKKYEDTLLKDGKHD